MVFFYFKVFFETLSIFSLCDRRTIDKDEENTIQHIVGSITNDLYALPMKKCKQKSSDQIDSITPEKELNSQNELPPGWEKHEGNVYMVILSFLLVIFLFLDNDGPYYWHIKSGTIQREIPLIDTEKTEKSDIKSNIKDCDLISSFESSMSVTRSSTSSALDLESDDRKKKEEIALK